MNETHRIHLLSARVEKRCTATAGIFPENNYKCFGIFVLYQHKKQNRVWQLSTKDSKTGLDKIIGNLNLICGCTPFGKNNCRQSLPVTIYKLVAPFNNFSFTNCSKSLRFEGQLLPTTILRSLHKW